MEVKMDKLKSWVNIWIGLSPSILVCSQVDCPSKEFLMTKTRKGRVKLIVILCHDPKGGEWKIECPCMWSRPAPGTVS